MNKLCMLLLALLGFAGCGGEKEETGSGSEVEEQPLMYGTPYATYTVKGRVTDKTGVPIAGIEVKRSAYDDPAAVRTDAQGAYAFEAVGDVLYMPPVVTFTDTDGPAGGGDFATKRIEVTFSEHDRTGPSEGWMYGRFERTGVDVALDPKTER